MQIPGWVKGVAGMFALVGVTAGVLYWLYVVPKADELKEKDPEKYAVLVDATSSLHFSRAKALYDELDAMTYEDVLTLRYRKWKAKRDENRKFRWEEWEKELELRKETEALKKAKYRELQKSLKQDLKHSRTGKALFVDWEEAGPWERGLLLREKCIKYLKLERQEERRRANVQQVARTTRLLKMPRGQAWNAAELCEQLVPIAHDPAVVTKALDNLKQSMNYFFFVQLLDEIGIPRKSVFSFPIQLDRMTGDFFDS